jgi:hypothetical protein
MKAFSRLIKNVFAKTNSDRTNIYREWDRMRSKATGPNDLAEIDAIFSRHA